MTDSTNQEVLWAVIAAKDAEIARLQAELAAVRQPNWRRGGAWGERAEVPPHNLKHVFIDDGAAGRRGVLLVDHDDDGGGWWTSCYRVDWEYIAWWIPLDELLDTIPEERPRTSLLSMTLTLHKARRTECLP